MPTSGPVNYRWQGPGAGLEVLGAGALTMWPNERWIGLALIASGALLIVYPILRWSVTTQWRIFAAALLVSIGICIGWFVFEVVGEDPPFQFDPRIEAVVGKTYKNAEVHVDGKSFRNTTFENVTLFYNGRAPWEFVDGVRLRGTINLRTENPSIFFYQRLSMMLRNHPHLRTETPGNVDKDGNVKEYTYSLDGKVYPVK